MSKVDEQQIIKITASGAVLHEKAEIGNLCISSPETMEAWELDYNQQSRDDRGNQIQVVSELNKKPLVVFKNRKSIDGLSVEDIGALEFDATIMEVQTENKKKSMMLWLGILSLILAIIVGLIVLLGR